MNDFQERLKYALDKIDLTQSQDQESAEEYSIEQEISELIRSSRVEAGMTQKQLSELSGIPQANISRIESGKICPSVGALKRIADALGKRLVIFFDEREVDE